MTSPYADLRARLAPLAAESADEWLTGDECSDLLDRWRTAYPEIDALLARGEAAEADADRLRGLLSDLRFEYAQIWDGLNAANEDATTLARRLANVPDRWQYKADAEALSAHARRLAASTPDTERPS